MRVPVIFFHLVWLTFAFPRITGAESERGEPQQQWKFTSTALHGNLLRPSIGNLGGEIQGSFRIAEQSGPECLVLGPADSAPGGGILLTTEQDVAKLPTGAMSVEAWVAVDETADWGGIIGAVLDTGTREAGWVLGYRRDRFYFGLATEGPGRITYLQSDSTMLLKTWYHVVATYDGIGEQRLYVDGRLDARRTGQQGPILRPDPLFYTIGAYRDDNDHNPFTGRLAEVSVWHRALLPEEVADRFAERKNRFPGIDPQKPERPGAEDEWVTWRGDNLRSGRFFQKIDLHPSAKPLWIYQPRHAPAPAWPGTAGSDHWRDRGTSEKPKVTFDWVNDVAVAGGRVYFGSSSDDSLRCLDAGTGTLLWTYVAGGPIRLAPTVSGEQVLFGCDDGAVYSLNVQNGTLRWKARPPSARALRLPGNGRMMSIAPIRTGVLVRGETAYFGAGLFPEEGMWYCRVNLQDGRIIEEKPIQHSPQGYIFERAGWLHSQAGRSHGSGALANVAARSKVIVPAPSILSKSAAAQFPFGLVQTPDRSFAGNGSGVAAFERGNPKPVWTAEVSAAARGLALAHGKLFVSTTDGRIHAFGASAPRTTRLHVEENRMGDPPSPVPASVDHLIKTLPRSRGYALVVGVGDGSLLRALAERTELHVVGVDTDGGEIARMRREFAALGLYGVLDRSLGRGSISLQEVETLEALPFADHLFNLILRGSSDVALPPSEAHRLASRWEGMVINGEGGAERVEPPAGAGQWTHAYADPGNSAASGEIMVDGEVGLRWFGRPGPERIIDRHMRAPPPLAGGGYLLVPGRDYLFGLDACNGTILWEREIPRFMRVSMLRDCGNLVLDPVEKRVFASAGSKCLILDLVTGRTVRELDAGVGHDWGYLALDQGVLVGSAVPAEAVRREVSKEAIWEGGYGDGKHAVCSHELFAIDPDTGNRHWNYQPAGAIANPSLCLGDGKVFFLESRNTRSLPAARSESQSRSGTRPHPGRWSYPDLLEREGADLVALDLNTGTEVWREPFGVKEGGILTLFLSCWEGHLIAVHSRNRPPRGRPGIVGPPERPPPALPVNPAKPRPTLHYDVRVLRTLDGSLNWERMFDTGRRPNLTHGEQDRHPVVTGGRLVVEPWILDVHSGKDLFTFARQGGSGCGSLSASSGKLFYRASNLAEFDLESREQRLVSKATRPGCWINMIPAGGLLLVPEGSSGCICSYPVQASMAFGPRSAQRRGAESSSRSDGTRKK